MKSKIVFADEELKKSFEKLAASKTEEKKLHENLVRAFEILELDAFAGIQIQKRLIPKEYVRKYGPLDNLWKYDLQDGWRLLYTIKRNDIIILSVILEWMDHKNYERRFKY